MQGVRRDNRARENRRKRWRTLWTATLAVFGLACLPALVHAQRGTQFVTEYRLDREMVEIPFDYERRAMLMKVQINDKKDLTFLFDTGATSLVLDTRLGIRGLHIEDTSFQEAEGRTRAEAVAIGDVKIASEKGTVHIRNSYTLLTDLSGLSRSFGKPIHGVIGIGVMAGYVVEIDYQKKLVRFYGARQFTIANRRPDNKKTFLFDLKPTSSKATLSCLQVTGKLHPEYEYDFLLDTGFNGYMTIAQTAAQESGLFNENTPRQSFTSQGLNRAFKSYRIRANYLTLGPIDLKGKTVFVDQRNKDLYGQFGILGNRFLQNYRVLLDYNRRKLWLERVTEEDEADEADGKALGLVVKVEGKTYRIDRVMRASPAEFAGLRRGDLIVSINGSATYEMSAEKVLTLLTTPKGRTTLELADGRDVTLEPTSPLEWDNP